MAKITKLFCIMMAASLLFADLGYSQSQKRRKRKSKTQVLNFEDELIKGHAQKPELFYLLERKQYNFKKLIRLRENFIPEMTSASEEIGTVGGGN